MDFFDSGGLSCRLLYRTSGLDGSIHLLLQLVREIFPIIRLNIVSGSSDLRVFVPIADTLPNGLTRVREAGKGRKSYPIIAHGSDLSKPLLLNDLESFKREALKIDPSVTELPFYSHAALLRLPLFARGSFTFLINFWSNEKNSFKEEDIEPLSRLIAPLAEELAAAFTDIPIAVGEVQERLTGYERIRQCAGLAALRQGIEKVAPTRTTVLVTGETGSGKELVAEAIHELSGRSGGPLVRVNCGSIAPTLLESELFGYEKGAFTGAQSRRSGYFECANGGTLFLDEIGELPLTAQVQLLRVLDRKIIQRVGDPRAIPVDVRVVAATNRDLEEMVEKGTFRRDLYYRLNVMSLTIAPLRMRSDDILLLLDYFLEKYGSAVRSEFLPPEVTKYLTAQTYPGNIRELENLAQRIEAFKEGETSLSMEEIMEIGDAPICRSDDAKGQANSESAGIGETLPADSLVVQLDSLDRIENQVIQHAMNYYGGNKTEVMNTLQISRTTLWKKLKEIEIEEESE